MLRYFLAVIYLRVSTSEQQKSGLGLEAQEEACRKLCRDRGYDVDAVFQETISSAINLPYRTAFMQAYLLAVTKKTIIIVNRLDRFSRTLGHISNYMDKETFDILDISGIDKETFNTLDKPSKRFVRIANYMDKETFLKILQILRFPKYPKIVCADYPDADILWIQMNGMMSQRERALVGMRTSEALAIRKANGVELGKAGRDAFYKKIDEKICDSMSRAMILYDDGKNYREIAEILNSEGYRNSKQQEWSEGNLYQRFKVRLKRKLKVEQLTQQIV